MFPPLTGIRLSVNPPNTIDLDRVIQSNRSFCRLVVLTKNRKDTFPTIHLMAKYVHLLRHFGPVVALNALRIEGMRQVPDIHRVHQ